MTKRPKQLPSKFKLEEPIPSEFENWAIECMCEAEMGVLNSHRSMWMMITRGFIKEANEHTLKVLGYGIASWISSYDEEDFEAGRTAALEKVFKTARKALRALQASKRREAKRERPSQ